MSTLIRPPPLDPTKSSIENVLELTQLSDIDPDVFTNTRPLWHPPGARGIYGGAVIAQCLSAAQRTVPKDFSIHSMHCYFVLAGNSDIPVIYHVEHVREGKSFATRTVQARQRGKAIFTTTMSFVKENSAGKRKVEHAVKMPKVPEPSEEKDDMRFSKESAGPFQSQRIEILNSELPHPELKKTRQWIKARGQISANGGHEAHLSALAYMSDSYFIGTVARVHKLWRFLPSSSTGKAASAIDPDILKRLQNVKVDEKLAKELGIDEDTLRSLQELDPSFQNTENRPEIGIMVSLDHTIYFHSPRDFRADEWMFTEMETPWAGDGRGLVFQRMFTKEGKLVATCVQEGLIRLKQGTESKL